jgi:hypothetical protein
VEWWNRMTPSSSQATTGAAPPCTAVCPPPLPPCRGYLGLGHLHPSLSYPEQQRGPAELTGTVAKLPHRCHVASVRARHPILARRLTHDSFVLDPPAHLHLAASLTIGRRAATSGPCVATTVGARTTPCRVPGRRRLLRPLGQVD